MMAIFKCEIKKFFFTPIVWSVFLGVFLTRLLYMPVLTSIAVFIIGIGSGIISKEFKNKCNLLLFSSPIRIIDIVIGKFLAISCSFIFVFLVLTTLDIFFFKCFGLFAMREIFSSQFICTIFAQIISICFFCSVMVFLSTWSSKSGLVASYGFFFYFSAELGGIYISRLQNFHQSVFLTIFNLMFNFNIHTYKINSGIFSLWSILYFYIMIAAFLFLSVKFLENRR